MFEYTHVHKHGSGPVGGQTPQAMGVSKGGLSTKIHAVCDALGYPLNFIITCEQRHDCTQTRALLEPHIEEAALVLLDAGYDSNELRAFIEEHGAQAVIAYRCNRKTISAFDKHCSTSPQFRTIEAKFIDSFFLRLA